MMKQDPIEVSGKEEFMKIQITSGQISINSELYDTPMGKAIAAALPITGTVNRWGSERMPGSFGGECFRQGDR